MEQQRISKSSQQKETLPTARSVLPARKSAHPILQLQHTMGNRAVGRFIQAKLTVSQPEDVHEQEADQVAEQVMRMPDASSTEGAVVTRSSSLPNIQRVCSECEEELHRQPTDEEEKPLQTKAISGGPSKVYPDFESGLDAVQGSSEPLPESERAFFEPRFGFDFSQVRVHTDAQAAKSARELNARAYTVGRDVVFGPGQYEPQTTAGRRLMAHELAHVVQQARMTGQQTSDSMAPGISAQKQEDETSHQGMLSPSVSRNQFTQPLCGSCSGDRTAAHTQIDGVPEESVGEPFFLLIDGPPPPQMTVHPSSPTPAILRQPIPSPNSVRIVQNHQIPITAAHVTAGWRSGFGGVSEVEVSNGTTDYDGTNISEHFIGGLGNNAQIGGCANQSGQGGQGGSTFTVGTGVNFSQNGLNINFPPKHNTFYDVHVKGFSTNILPAGTNFQFSLCVQRYSFGGSTIWGRLGGLLPAIFFRFHGINRRTVGGQDVADIDLVKF
jgi:hypothetical protein